MKNLLKDVATPDSIGIILSGVNSASLFSSGLLTIKPKKVGSCVYAEISLITNEDFTSTFELKLNDLVGYLMVEKSPSGYYFS